MYNIKALDLNVEIILSTIGNYLSLSNEMINNNTYWINRNKLTVNK